jgi:hypothetical protein
MDGFIEIALYLYCDVLIISESAKFNYLQTDLILMTRIRNEDNFLASIRTLLIQALREYISLRLVHIFLLAHLFINYEFMF